MAKYTVSDDAGSGKPSQCELCGNETSQLSQVKVEGASLFVCRDCQQHDDSIQQPADEIGHDGEERDTTTELPSDTSPLWDSDTEHWEKHGTEYDKNQLPYLVEDYGQTVVEARRDAGLTREELAEKIEVDVEQIDMVEQETAYSNNVPGSVISKLEAYFEIELAEQQ